MIWRTRFERTIELLHSELLGKQVQLHLDLEPDSPVLADKAQVQQVILNLVMNAVEAMQSQPAGQRRLELTIDAHRRRRSAGGCPRFGSGHPRGSAREGVRGVLDDQASRGWGLVSRSRGPSSNPTGGAFGLQTTRTRASLSTSRSPLHDRSSTLREPEAGPMTKTKRRFSSWMMIRRCGKACCG